MTYKHTVLGGTFDRLHDGHISYLRTAFENSNRVTIGLTTDKFHRDKELKQIIQPYNSRKKELLKAIKGNWPMIPVVILPIEDIFGPSIVDPTIDTVVVTDNTLENGKKINKERTKRGLNTLNIIICPILCAGDSLILSSSRIRRGEIDRKGKVYSESFLKTLNLPEKLRPELRKPLGRVIKGDRVITGIAAAEVKGILEKGNYNLTITVGDIVSHTLENAGFTPDIKVIDFKTQRKFLPSYNYDERFDIENIAGTIDSNSVNFLKKEIEKIVKNKTRKLITINGEEDLLVLPAILLAPLDSVVFYGLKDVGMVMVEVTEKMKKQVLELLKRFT